MIYRGGGEDAAGGIEMLTLKRVDVRPVVVPLKRHIVSRVGFFDAWPLILIDLYTEEGIVGRSYLAPGYPWPRPGFLFA